ncbi:FAD binding domain-containing protein [Rhexocercosporidium sp. MPI-PUGE-AT-0058]|nr:FAD binding domain-containing protein [Rhexocercosporidium sp. MPI-PUGE-AT-0058]
MYGTFTDRSMQAAKYRERRVLLVGDAAHDHSPLRSQGLNLGIGDAMNLGWKLTATIRQEIEKGAPLNEEEGELELLDSYEEERYEVGAKALEWSRAQAETIRHGLAGTALQNIVKDVAGTRDGTKLFISRIWGLEQRYDFGDEAHPLVECSMPDFELEDGERLGVKLECGRELLVDFEDGD